MIELESIRRAAVALEGVAVRTPLLTAPADALPGAPVGLKCEQLQPIGAFKVRGAFTAISRLSAAERARGVVTHSSGNHGQAVAFVARHFGVRAIIVMPADAPGVKVDGVRRYGAEVAFVEERWQRQSRCDELALEHGMVIVPPYENPDVIAGQGTCGLEILEQWPEVETIVVQVGGGGLIAGIAAAVHAVKPSVEVIAAEPEGAAKLARALEAGHPVRLEQPHSIADGLLPFSVGTLPFEVLSGIVRRAVQVSDDEIAAAVKFLHERMQLHVEPSGAASFAAVLAGRIERTGPTVAVLSGGNVDPAIFERLVQ
ncbi:MAG: threonine/serine dehydratase [Gemmatimonadales bacterium]|nr:threonine/serine dehydratase [Gemmatimonadales bacterium]